MENQVTQTRKPLHVFAVLFLTFGAALGAFALSFVDGPLYASGNLHDFFIPLNAGYYWQRPETFYSPFGPIYGYLNNLSLNLLWGHADLNKITQLTTLLWMPTLIVALLTLFITGKFSGRTFSTIDTLFWGVALTYLLSFRDMHDLNYRNLNFYGSYNNHLWSILLTNTYIFIACSFSPKKGWPVLLAALWFWCSFWLATLYKINFAPAFFLLIVGLYIIMDRRLGWIHLLLTAAATIAPIFYLTHSTAEWLQTYAKGLEYAFAAKAQGAAHHSSWKFPALTLLTYYCITRFWRDKFPYPITRRTDLLALTITIALTPAYLGDFARPSIVFGIALMFLLYNHWPESTTIRRISIIFCVTFIAIGVASNLETFRLKKQHNTDRYQAMHYNQGPTQLSFTLRKHNNFSNLVSRLDQLPSPWEDIFLYRLSCSYRTNPQEGYSFSNSDYFDGISSTATWLAHNHLNKYRINFLEFTNPFPILAKSPPPGIALHWTHFGTTVSDANVVDILNTTIRTSDVIVVPTLNVDGLNQTRLNNIFYAHVLSEHDFVLAKRIGIMLVFARKEIGLRPLPWTGCQ